MYIYCVLSLEINKRKKYNLQNRNVLFIIKLSGEEKEICLIKHRYEECCSQKHYKIAPFCFLPAQSEHSFSLGSIIGTYHHCVPVSSPLNKHEGNSKRSRSPLKRSPSRLMLCDPCFVRVTFLIYTVYSLRAGSFRKSKGR